MSKTNSSADATHQMNCAFRVELAFPPEQFSKRLPCEQLHDDVSGCVGASGFAVIVDCDDVWMAQFRCRSRLTAESLHSLFFSDELAAKNLQGDFIPNEHPLGTVDD